jgi:hypothetical protein
MWSAFRAPKRTLFKVAHYRDFPYSPERHSARARLRIVGFSGAAIGTGHTPTKLHPIYEGAPFERAPKLLKNGAP